MTGEQVAGSIAMFGFIYLLLGALWLVVLNHKIQVGPEEPEPAEHDLLGAAGALASHEGSLTGDRKAARG